MLDWVRRLLGPIAANVDPATRLPQVELDAGMGVRLLATLVEDCTVYDVIVDHKDHVASYPRHSVLQTENVDVAARFFLGTARAALVTADDMGYFFTLRVGVVGTELVGIGDMLEGDALMSSGEYHVDAIDRNTTKIIEGLKTLLAQHVTPTSRVIRPPKRARAEHEGIVSRKRHGETVGGAVDPSES